MAVCSVKFVLLLSIIMMQSTICMLQSTACEQPMCTSVPEVSDMCVLPNTTCEVQWTPSAVSLGTQHLYSLIASNSATVHHFLTQINNTEGKTAVIQAEIAASQAEIANVLENQTETLTQISASLADISVSQTQVVATQNQMASALDAMVNILQMQSLQLYNMTATMNRVVSVLENQQETDLEKIKLLEINSNQLENLTVTLNKQLDIDNRAYQAYLQIPSRANDCSQIASQGYQRSKPYTIVLANELQDVYCDMDTDGGGWTVFQRRYDGSVDFYQPWNEYEEGFGRSDGEFWLGLRKIHQLTQSGSWVLRVDIEAFDGSRAYALYDSFRVGNAETNYTLSYGTYQGGTAGDSMRGSNNMQFSTYDRDNDVWGDNCAEDRGAWWYHSCTYSNLNGRYLGSSRTSYKGMTWYYWNISWQNLKRSEMKIRRTQ